MFAIPLSYARAYCAGFLLFVPMSAFQAAQRANCKMSSNGMEPTFSHVLWLRLF